VTVSRRRFLQTAAALSAAAALPARWAAAAGSGSPKKAVLVSMLPKELPYVDRFRIAVDAGFAGIEMQTMADAAQAEDVRKASPRRSCASTPS
jgi:hypothetical protein